MKITRKQLGRIIQEELDAFKEGVFDDVPERPSRPPLQTGGATRPLSPQQKHNTDLAIQFFENLKRFYTGEIAAPELLGDTQSAKELLAFLEGITKSLRDGGLD